MVKISTVTVTQSDCIANLRKDRYDWTIKVRVIRKWRNTNSAGQLVKGINFLLIDDKNCTIQAFAGKNPFDQFSDYISVGQVYQITNFSVKDVAPDAIYLITKNCLQIFFTPYTTVEEAQDNLSLIPENYFDFYEIEDLCQMQNQIRYLTDVMGVIEYYQPIRRWVNHKEKGKKKALLKFMITDGSFFVRAVLWDEYAEEFQQLIDQAEEQPYIVIIAGARIIFSKDAVEIATVRATTFFINNNYPSVQQMRKLVLATPDFTQTGKLSNATVNYPICKVDEVNKLGEENIGKKVVMMLTIQKMQTGSNWFFYECTTCQEELTLENGEIICAVCERDVTYADRKFQVGMICSDGSGTISLILEDREVRALISKTVFDLTPDDCYVSECHPYPQVLKNLTNSNIRALLKLSDIHVKEGCNVFTADQVLPGHTDDDQSVASPSKQTSCSEITSHYPQLSTSEYHLDDIIPMQKLTPVADKTVQTKKKGKRHV